MLVPWTFGRRSLVWPVTASARGRSFLADPGTCRAGPAAPLGVPATARRLLPLPLKRQPQPQTLPLLFYVTLFTEKWADLFHNLLGGQVKNPKKGW